MKFKFYILITVLFILGGCMDRQQEFDFMLENLLSGSVPYITASELDSLEQEPVLLDIRTEEEFAVSHIEGARFIPYDSFDEDMVSDLPRDTSVVVYCAVGYRSEKIGEKLQEMGFKNIRNLYGGIFAWKNSGHVVVDPSGHPTDSVHAYDSNWSRWLWNGTKVYDK